MDAIINELDTQERIKNRNKKLALQNIRLLCSDYQYESKFLWSTDPYRQFNEVYDWDTTLGARANYQ